MLNHFNEESGVAGGVRTLQRLWASRSGVSSSFMGGVFESLFLLLSFVRCAALFPRCLVVYER